MNTTGRCSGGMWARRPKRSSRPAGIRSSSTPTRRLIAPVIPAPVKITACARPVAADRVADDRPGVLAEARRLEAGPGRLGVGVRVQRQDRVADVVLDERQGAAARRVVGVGHAAQPERPGDGLVVADDRRADPLDQGVGVRAGLARAAIVRARSGRRHRTNLSLRHEFALPCRHADRDLERQLAEGPDRGRREVGRARPAGRPPDAGDEARRRRRARDAVPDARLRARPPRRGPLERRRDREPGRRDRRRHELRRRTGPRQHGRAPRSPSARTTSTRSTRPGWSPRSAAGSGSSASTRRTAGSSAARSTRASCAGSSGSGAGSTRPPRPTSRSSSAAT